MAFVFVDSGRQFMAQQLMAASAVHLAWGGGDPSWSNGPPDVDTAAAALTAEVGRRKATVTEYVEPDAGGEIDLGDLGTFTVVAGPTRYVYMRFTFDLADGVGEDIKEVGIFLNTVANGGVPGGQMYLVPAEVSSAGTLFSLSHLSPAEQFTANGVVRHQWEYLHTA